MESSEKSNPNYISCSKHFYKKAKKFCNFSECKKLICNNCALEEHSGHLENLQNIQKFYRKEFDSLESFNNEIENELKNFQSKGLSFKCLNNVFHEAKNFCQDCNNFLCLKCSSSHQSNHKIISNMELFDNLNKKLKNIRNIFNKEKFFLDFLEKENILIHSINKSNKNIEENILENAYKLKFKFEGFNKILRNFKLYIIGKLNEIFSKKNNNMFKIKPDLTKLAFILDSFKFEKDKNKFFGNFLKNEPFISSILTDEESKQIDELIELNDKTKIIFEKNLIEYDKNIEEICEKFIVDCNNYEETINKIKSEFIEECKRILPKGDFSEELSSILSEESEFTNFLDFGEIRGNFIINETQGRVFDFLNKERNIEDKKLLEKSSNLNEDEIYKKFRDNFSKNLISDQSIYFDIFKDEKNPIEIIEKTQLIENDTMNNEKHENIEIKETEVIKYINNTIFLKENLHFYQTETFSIENKIEKVKNNELCEYENLDQETHRIIEIKEEKEIPQISHKNSIKSDTNQNEIEIIIPGLIERDLTTTDFELNSSSNDLLFCEEKFDQNEITDNNENNNIERIDTDMNSINEIPDNQGNSRKVSTSSKISENKKEDLENLLSHDMVSFGFNCRSCFIFNPNTKKITEIENPFFKFPSFHAFINIPPLCYIGGGKDSSGKEVSTFSKFQREGEKSLNFIELKNMLNPRHHHRYVYYREKQQIICIGGSKRKSNEIYDMELDSWNSLPDLNVSRECPSACITNELILFVFFGFDKNVNKYVNTIERLDLSNITKFEILSIKGNQNVLKKHSTAALLLDNEKILIFGGINSLRNSCRDILVYDFIGNSVQFFSANLPYNTSFYTDFLSLEIYDVKGEGKGKIFYNFCEDFKTISFNIDGFNMEVLG